MPFTKTLIKSAVACIALCTSSIVLATPMFSFIIDGNTFTQAYRIDNTSDANEMVTRFQLDLSTITAGTFCFDTLAALNTTCNTGITNTGLANAGVPFASVGGAAANTGLVGTDAANNPADGASLLDISFTDFNSGEFFSWDIDVDEANNVIADQTVFGNELIGATATIDFSDGQRLTGELFAVDQNPDASQFNVTGITRIPDPDPDPNPMPTPGSLVLLALGLAVMGYRRKRST